MRPLDAQCLGHRRLKRKARAGTEESQLGPPQTKLEEPAASRRAEVVITAWLRPGDELDLPGVETEALIGFPGSGGRRRRIREIKTRGTGFADVGASPVGLQLPQVLHGEHEARVFLAQRKRPLLDPRGPGRVHERDPGLVQENQGRRAV